jgi:phosphatidylglycerol:prolipoprotein diacylglycerol transferase
VTSTALFGTTEPAVHVTAGRRGDTIETDRAAAGSTPAPARMVRLRRHGTLSGCVEAFEDASASAPQAVSITYWGEATGQPIALRLTGTRHSEEEPGPHDRIDRSTCVPALDPGVGRFAFTARAFSVAAGRWNVSAARIGGTTTQRRPQRAVTASRPMQLSFGPAVRLWTWPVLVGAGAVLAIVLQALLVHRGGADARLAVVVSLVGCVAGYLGAKAWYLASARQHPRRFLTTGACIQGFLLVAFAVLAVGGTVTSIGAGTLLDATTPGLFLGMAVGRPGCFLTGCCAGRPTSSRWGVWSSDRTLAVRRIPVQLWEALAALLIGVSTLVAVLSQVIPVPGTTFLAAMATYTGARQILFPFRADPHTRRGRYGTLAACAVILAVVVAAAVMIDA